MIALSPRPHSHPRSRRGQQGYALLIVLFLSTLLLLSTMSVAPNILTQGRREREIDMIWRGKQYTRGVKLYYRKLGRFPTSLDDLTKPKVGSLHFMRQAYKDPMNKDDGSWRLIYVGPAGQLIGSLKPQPQNLQFPGAPGVGAPGIGTPAGSLGSLNGTSNPQQGSVLGGILGAGSNQLSASGGFGQPSTAQTGAAGNNANNAAGTNGTNGSNPSGATGAGVSADQGTPDDSKIPMGDTPTIMGGNIIGVGSKINQRSIIVYEKAKNYRLYEFIWDPSKDNVIGGQPGLQTGNPIGQQLGQPAGQSPFGQQPATGFGQQPGVGQPGGQQPPLSNPPNQPNPQQP